MRQSREFLFTDFQGNWARVELYRGSTLFHLTSYLKVKTSYLHYKGELVFSCIRKQCPIYFANHMELKSLSADCLSRSSPMLFIKSSTRTKWRYQYQYLIAGNEHFHILSYSVLTIAISTLHNFSY